jgi:outer membrane protein OmpA-like peptidoglycan-associated protein/opacity protein-like surface antigen
MNTTCLNIAKTIVMSAMLMGSQALLAQATQTASNNAKPKYNRFGIGIRVSHLYDVKYNGFGKLSNGFEASDPQGLNGSKTNFDLGYGVNLNYFLTPTMSIDASYDLGKMTGRSENSIEYYNSDVTFLTLGFNLDLKGNDRVKPYRFVPYLRASIATSSYDTKRKFVSDDGVIGATNGTAMQVGLGAGVRLHLTNNWFLNLQSEFVQTYTDAWDGYDYGSGRDYMAKTSFGLNYTFGKNKHLDRITNSQRNIMQVNSASNSATNSSLLALNDSLKNINDKLAKIQASNDQLNKDSDGDGVKDYRDQCPDVKGTLPNGCNEVAKEEKSYVTEPNKTGNSNGTTVVNPSGTNVADPKVTQPVVTNPITTNPNALAQTQNISNSLKQELRNMLLVEMNRIYFETNKANLNATDKVILTQCARVLMDNPSFKLTVLGYADNVGSDDANFVLSRKRAEAVTEYLVNLGVAKSNISLKAMGAQKMIGDDAQKSNAFNRRVEFILE